MPPVAELPVSEEPVLSVLSKTRASPSSSEENISPASAPEPFVPSRRTN